ncbi:hypothetical protein GOODEAATRI_004697, partial [Goodea atripinnis]
MCLALTFLQVFFTSITCTFRICACLKPQMVVHVVKDDIPALSDRSATTSTNTGSLVYQNTIKGDAQMQVTVNHWREPRCCCNTILPRRMFWFHPCPAECASTARYTQSASNPTHFLCYLFMPFLCNPLTFKAVN